MQETLKCRRRPSSQDGAAFPNCPVPENGPVLKVEDLSKTFTMHLLGGRRVNALNGVSFQVDAGQCVVVVGASGAGKSTLLKCIYRTYIATGGSVWFRTAAGETEDLAAVAQRRALELRRDEICYVPQFLKAPPRVPAVDVVSMPHAAAGPPEQVRDEARQMLSFLGIGLEQQSSYPAVFSGGEQQRVNAARALLRPRRLILLDEPTSALDAENRERVLSLLSSTRKAGAAMIALVHDLPTLERLADRVMALEDGRVAQFGPPGEVDVSRYVGRPA